MHVVCGSEAVEGHEPQRQCIGCGRRGPQADFVRLTLDQGVSPARVVVTVSGEHPGRGAYLCRRQACLDRALQRKAFQRAFRAAVIVDENGIVAEIGTDTPRVTK